MKTKYFILTLLLQSVMMFSAFSQQLKGVQEFSGNRSGGYYYNKVNWTASYTITFDGYTFYINLINPTTSASSTSLYGRDNEFYSKSDLGLTNWPNTNPTTANFTLNLTVIMPDGKADNTRYGKKDEPASLATIADYKGATISSFKVSSVQSMSYNGGGDGMLDKLIFEKKNNTQKPVTSSGNQTNSNQSKNTGLPANTSGNDPLANYNSQTNTSGNNNPLINYNTNISTGSSAVDNFNKGYQQGQQIGEIAIGIASLFTPSPEEIQRREQASAEYARQKKIEEDLAWEKRKIDDKNRFDLIYLPLMDEAIKGNENARMILYFASYHLLSTGKVPKRDQWFREAYENKNPDAYMFVAQEEKDKGNDWISYTQAAANVGSVDAMLRLAEWYDRKKDVHLAGITWNGGGDSKLALELYTRAAEKGSPNAMYYLGMIYKYGQTPDISNGYGSLRKVFVKHDVVIDEEKALVWFAKSIQPNYAVSLFATGNETIYENYTDLTSYFNKESYKELSLIYKKGKIVPKDKVKAKELMRLYESYGKNYGKHKF